MREPKSRKIKLQKRSSEIEEIKLLEEWIASGKPDSGCNPLALPTLPPKSRIGKLTEGSFSPYAGADKFVELPLSKKTKKGLAASKFVKMTDIQRACIPHALCDRDILGAAKTGSGKTLAFIVPVLEKLYRLRWGPEDGVGCIIMSPTRELAGQTFDVLNSVGKEHGFSAGLLIGGRKNIDTEKEHVNQLNILVCTPGRLLQHMDETQNFECPQLQVLVLDEGDRMLDVGFKKDLNAIISQLPKYRQTLLFSATQTKSVQSLARLSLKDPEYISVHEKSKTATPNQLEQTAMFIPLDQKLDMLWSFLKAHIHSRILVFLSTCKQVKFVYETFKKLRPGVPLKCLHGRMKQDRRMGIYEQFCEKQSILFVTDVASRGLDFNKVVDWVVQVDCPDDTDSYIHRVGRTARYHSGGRSILFLTPSETKMLDKLHEKKIPIRITKANIKRLQPVSGLLAALLVKYPNLQQLGQRAFITYLKSIFKQRDKEVFDVTKLPIDEYSASLGLPMTPKVRFLKLKGKGKNISENLTVPESTVGEDTSELSKPSLRTSEHEETELQDDLFINEKDDLPIGDGINAEPTDAGPGTRVLKKKKLKINLNRPVGTRVVFDDEGNMLPPLAKLADMNADVNLDKDKVSQRYAELREKMKVADKEDKELDRQRRKELRNKRKMKLKRDRDEEEDDDDAENEGDVSGSDGEAKVNNNKKSKIYFDNDDDNEDDGSNRKNMGIVDGGAKQITLAEQEALALKLLSSMHS